MNKLANCLLGVLLLTLPAGLHAAEASAPSQEPSLSNVPPGGYRLERQAIGFERNDAYSAYLKMGAPAQLTRDQEKSLQAAASGDPVSGEEVKVGADGIFQTTLPLREIDVWLLSLSPE